MSAPAHVLAPKSKGPQVRLWGTDGNLLSIVVRNNSSEKLTAGHVLITAYDANHNQVASTSGRPDSKCCTIFSLPPGGDFALFADLGTLTARVASVQVLYLDAAFVPWAPGRDATMTARDPVLGSAHGDAYVTATLSGHGAVGPYAVGQAFLTGPSGRLVGVISGRFYCFAGNVSRRLRMQFLHPVPPGTQIAAVVAYPIPAGQPSLIRDPCTA